MRLNTLRPAPGSRPRRKRVGRGIGSGLGKTCGRGHKGHRARTGGGTKAGFEGGQMPLQRRLPKSGFTSLRAREEVEVRLHELARVEGEVADLAALKAARVVPGWAKRARVIRSGSLGRAVVVRGVGVTKGARAAIEAAGGRVED